MPGARVVASSSARGRGTAEEGLGLPAMGRQRQGPPRGSPGRHVGESGICLLWSVRCVKKILPKGPEQDSLPPCEVIQGVGLHECILCVKYNTRNRLCDMLGNWCLS